MATYAALDMGVKSDTESTATSRDGSSQNRHRGALQRPYGRRGHRLDGVLRRGAEISAMAERVDYGAAVTYAEPRLHGLPPGQWLGFERLCTGTGHVWEPPKKRVVNTSKITRGVYGGTVKK